MNKNLYRVVFSKKTGACTVAAETACCHRQSSSSGSGLGVALHVVMSSLCLAGAASCFTPLALTVAIMFGGINIVYAQIKADPNATGNKRPVIDNTANGLPLVQIATPNAAGVSHNQYQQFNVDKSGAILNNASNNAYTQLGGWVGGNPNLPNGGARIILNEVTSTNPSVLRGYLEVAGQRADVVISNQNGILVDGAGFINASRGVIATGAPILGGSGSLDGFRVSRGVIEIGTGGFNDRNTDQVDLIARSVQVNGQLYANRLNVVAGANQVNYAVLGVQIIQGAGNAPAVAIDVAALGGMFANSIRMIGTEAGVGVRSYGKMAATVGDVSIDIAGKITLAADISATDKLHISSGDSIINQAKVTSGGNMDLQAANVIDNHGKQLLSGGNLSMNSTSLNNAGGTVQSNRNARVVLRSNFTNARGDTFAAAGDLAVNTTGNFVNHSDLTAGGNLSVLAANIDNRKDGLLSAGQTTLLQADQSITNTGRVFGQDIAVSGKSLTNDHEGTYGDGIPAGAIAARNTLNMGAATIVNREHALIKSDGDMSIGGALDSSNKATGTAISITNSSAAIDSGGKLNIASAKLLNTNAHFASDIELDSSKTRSWTEYEIDGSPTIYTPEEVTIVDEGDHNKIMVNATGARQDNYTRRIIKETTNRTVVTQTDPGKILARSDMTLTGGTVTNDKSAIVAGGNLNAQIDGANNGGTNPQGEIFVHRDIESMRHTTESCGFLNSKRCNKEDYSHPDVDLPVTHFDLGIWQAAAHTQPNSTANPANGNAPSIAQLIASQLYRPVTTPGQTYLIETDPAFANYRNFLSSDYLLNRMGMNPQTAPKRLGDGYYEQQLINNQILELTGKKTLGAYASNEDQYKALMDAGVVYAQQFQLVPGMTLSAAQMAALTTDLVWLVSQNVTLTDGSVQQVLVPVVYLSQLHAQDVKPTGALISADNIDLKLNGTLDNAGTLKANGNLIVNAGQDINNKLGTIQSDATNGTTALIAARDLNNQSGTIEGNRIGMLAGRDINAGTLANTTIGSAGTQIGLDRTGSINAGTLTAQAQRDINLSAASVNTTGDATFVAGNNLNLNAVKTQAELNATYDDKNHLHKRQEQANGTMITTGGNATLVASNDINSQAAYVNADKNLTAVAGGNVNIGTATQNSSYDQEVYTASSSILSSKSMHSKDLQTGTQAIGSTLSGNNVTVQSGKDLNVVGSNVVSTTGTSLAAVNNVNIVTSQNTANQTYSKEEKQSGLFSGGGIGVTLGSRSMENDQTSKQVTNNASTVGSTNGNVNIAAGKTYTQTGSNVTTPTGDINIAAKRVDINAAADTLDTTQDTHFKQSGITLQLTSPVLSAIQTAQQMKQASSQTKDARLQALAGATAGLSAVNAADAVAQNPAAAGGINIAISLGASKSDSHSEQHASTAKGSNVAAGGNVNIAAAGDGNNSDLTVAGSSVTAKNNIALQADHDLNLIAAANTAEQHSTNSGSSASIGIGFSVGGSQNGFTLNAGVSGSRGNADGKDVGYTNTQIAAGNQLKTTSGNDTNLKGAVASGKQVTTTVGNNLNIESLQDTSTYNSKQQSAGVGVSLCIPPFCYGASSASANLSQSKINSNYASVNEQSGIKAGDGGFNVNVKGNTDLKGTMIASTDKAVQDGKNSLTTGTLTHSDIQNRADYKGQSASIGGGYNFGGSGNSNNGVGTDQQGKAQSGPGQVPGTTLPADKNGLAMNAPVVMNAKGSASSTTQSGISGGQLNITNNQAQQQKTGETAQQASAAVNRDVASDKDGTNTIKPIFNEKEIQAGFAITAAFANEVNTYINNRAKEADAKKKAANDPNRPLTQGQREQLLKEASDSESKWGPGGIYRQIATALTAAASGNVTGGAGQFVQAASVSYLQSLGAEQVKRIADSIGNESARAALHAVVGCAGAAAQGANCGAGAMGASVSSVLGSLLGPANSLSNEEKEARKNTVTSLIAGIAATGNNAATATGAGQIEAENNTLYVWRNNVMRTDKIPNDKVVVLGKQDAWRILKQPVKDTGYPQSISAIRLDQLVDSQIYDLTLAKDFETLRKGTDMGYYTTSDNTRVYFQNGMDNHAPDAKASSALLADLLKQPVGAIINDSHGIGGDVKEYLPDTFTTKDILNEYTYRKLDAQGQPVLIVMHSAGNEDAHKALEAGRVYGYQYPNLSFMSVGSPVSADKLQSIMQQTGATYMGQVNNWRDPVTNSKTAGALALGVTAAGVWTGMQTGISVMAPMGAGAGPMGAFFSGLIGGAVGGGAGIFALKNYHPFTQYFQNQQLQQQVLDWQKQQQPINVKK